MTCPHIKHRIINKKKGNSLFSSLSYNSRSIVYDETSHHKFYPHASSKDLACVPFMMLPKDAPKKYQNVEICFNDINRIEKEKIAINSIVPFQKELSFQQNVQLIKDLIYETYVKKGHPVYIAIHKGKNGNDHAHVMAITRRLVNGKWENQKSDTLYYLKGTVKELDENGKVINPDAVLLYPKDKVDTPVLKRRKLQYDKDGNIIFKKGWQQLQYDKNGKPLLDDKGHPVLIDIREPDYDRDTGLQKLSKNGDYESHKQWKRVTVKHSDIDDKNNYAVFRKTWEKLQNEYFKKYNVRDENGNILQVDLRSYAEQNKDRPMSEHLIPTVHVFRPKRDKSLNKIFEKMLADNEIAKENNRRVKEFQAFKFAAAKFEKQTKEKEKQINKSDIDIAFYNKFNPRETFISDYEKSYNDMLRRQNRFFHSFKNALEENIAINKKEYQKLENKKSKRSNALRYCYGQHQVALTMLQHKISKTLKSGFLDIRQKASDAFDKLNNEEIASYMSKRYGEETAPVIARALEKIRPDNSNPFNAEIKKSPFFPDENTNDKVFKSVSKKITGNPNFEKLEQTANEEWKQKPGQAPPKSVREMVNIYLTADDFYNTKLDNKKWYPVILDQRTMNENETINKEYEDELNNIIKQEYEEKLEQQKASAAKKPVTEKQPEPQNTLPENPDDRTHDEHVLVHKNMGIERDKLFNTMIDLANPYANEDIRKIVYESGKNAGKPYRTKQTNRIKEIEETYHPPGLKDIIDDWENIRKEIDDYYKKYVNPQKPPADLSPDRNSGNRTKSRGRK